MSSPAQQVPTPASGAIPAWTRALPALAVVAALGLAWVVAGLIAVGPVLPGRLQADPFTGTVSVFGDLVARLAAGVTLGAFAGIAAFTDPGADGRLSDAGRRLARIASRSAQLWLWASVLETCANSAYVNGVALAYTLRPAAWWDFQSSTPSGLAWTLSALVALGCVVVAYAGRTVAPFALSLLTGAVALVFVAVTGNVSVGAAHDWATDAAGWLTLSMVVLATALVACWLVGDADGAAGARLARYRRLAPGLLALAAVGHAIVGWQQLAGTPPLSDAYGRVTLGLLGCLALLALAWGVRAATRRGGWTALTFDVVVLVAYVALLTAENHLPSPRFLIPQTIQINYLGYEMPTPATIERLLGRGRPNWLWVLLVALAVGSYLVGVAKVRRAGGHWPVQRIVSWLAGWTLMLFLAVSGLWEYSTVVYSWHMFVHMTVNMLVPALCVLGGPITLLRAATGASELPTLAGVGTAIGAHRPFLRLFSPPLLWLNYVGSLFLIYYTPLFPWLMRYHWAHQLMLLYFMATGYAFFNLIVGVDRQARDLPHLVRLALVISIMPFHALFAVGIMSSKSLIGGDFYRSIAIPWVSDLMADQSTAGQITWILGEIPLFIVMIALAAQWFAHDKAENAVSDVAQDTGVDDSFDAYNDMLAQLADRDRRDAGKAPR